MKLHRRLAGMMLALGTALSAWPAFAENPLNAHQWDFRVRRSPAAIARATTMWQVEQAARANGSGATTASAPGSVGLPGIGSVANMNIVTVMVGNNSTVDVAVEAEQENHGEIDATSVIATGNMVDIGQIGDIGPGR
ncbi:hypothetical protein [Sphingopyxis sp.]|uniref:hypothetical protein n=1 Tax=Sphingopyxis sp. TaxID=1908224 RepID=UPI002B45D64F|nr:hypothetical protein [Sphingopyxis sp.]HJS10500.1 hypothetical protein [Sphingopyxis sp.]HKY80061.1 hypothetical protein [Sphingobium sp.]